MCRWRTRVNVWGAPSSTWQSETLHVKERVVMARISKKSGADLLDALRVSVIGTVVCAGLVMGVIVVAMWNFPVPGV